MPDNPGRRLRLAPLSLSEAPALFRLVDTNRAYLRQWLDWPDSVRSESDTRAFIAGRLKDAARGEALDYCIYHAGRLVGIIGLRDIAARCGLVGYWVSEQSRGRGIATGALQALIAAARCRALVDTIVLRSVTSNIASRAVAEKCGFRYIETLPGGITLLGKAHDLAVYERAPRGGLRGVISTPRQSRRPRQ